MKIFNNKKLHFVFGNAILEFIIFVSGSWIYLCMYLHFYISTYVCMYVGTMSFFL